MYCISITLTILCNVVVPFAYDACSVPETYSRFDDFRSF